MIFCVKRLNHFLCVKSLFSEKKIGVKAVYLVKKFLFVCGEVV